MGHRPGQEVAEGELGVYVGVKGGARVFLHSSQKGVDPPKKVLAGN